jgi:hypothetical protein
MRWILIVAFVLIVCVSRADQVAAFNCLSPDVPAGETATLGSDMECGLVHMGPDATFDLNGHTFTGLIMGPEDGGLSRYTIRGPGEIHAQFPDNPCVMIYSGRVLIDGGTGQVTLTQCGYGVLANVGGSRVTLRNVTLRRTIQVPMLLGVQASKVLLENVTIDHRDAFDIIRGDGIVARKIKGTGVVLRHLAKGLSASMVRVSDVTADDVTIAIASTRRADVTGLVSTRHWIGAYSKRLRLTSSTLSDATPGGIDLAASRLPVLVDTTCERSGSYDPQSPGLVFGPGWGVCSLD